MEPISLTTSERWLKRDSVFVPNKKYKFEQELEAEKKKSPESLLIPVTEYKRIGKSEPSQTNTFEPRFP